MHFHGQLSEPQINLKKNDEPEPKPPASNIFALVFVFFLVPVVAPSNVRLAHIKRNVASIDDLSVGGLGSPGSPVPPSASLHRAF